VWASPEMGERLGYPAAKWLGEDQDWYSVLHPDDRDGVLAATEVAHAGGTAFSGEYRLVASDGRVVWVRDEATIVQDEQGRPLFAQGFLLDVSDRQRAHEEQDRLESGVRQAPPAGAGPRPSGGR